MAENNPRLGGTLQKEEENFERIDEPEINKRIVLLFLEKLELLSEQERREILKIITLFATPILISGRKL